MVFERFEAARPVGSGLILQPTGQAVLQDLGLLDEIAGLGQVLDRLHGADARSGRVVLDVRYDALPRNGRGLGIHRAALFGVLHDAVVRAGIAVRIASEVAGLQDGADGKRQVVLADGSVSAGFDLVVDCLGANSPLRRHSRRPGRAKPLTFGAIWATLPWQGEDFDATALSQRYRRASVMVGVLPVGRSRADGPKQAAMFWSLKPDDYAQLQTQGLNAWKETVLGHWPEMAAYLDQVGDFSEMTLARYAHFTMPDPTGRALVFVGDSAHSASPQLGQGANMALLDARALYLALRDRAGDVEGALQHYARLRRWHLRLYQALSAMFTPFYQSDSRMLPLIRDVFVSALARIPPAPQFLAALVAGSLLSPLKRLELKRPPRL